MEHLVHAHNVILCTHALCFCFFLSPSFMLSVFKQQDIILAAKTHAHIHDCLSDHSFTQPQRTTGRSFFLVSEDSVVWTLTIGRKTYRSDPNPTPSLPRS